MYLCISHHFSPLSYHTHTQTHTQTRHGFLDVLPHHATSVGAVQRKLLSHTQTSTHPHTHIRIHPIYNHTSVRTGRLSAQKPNIQTLPKTQIIEGISVNVRSLITGTPGVCMCMGGGGGGGGGDSQKQTQTLTQTHMQGPAGASCATAPETDTDRHTHTATQMQGTVLLAADYSQIEMRVLAAMSGDAKMINLFRQEGDVYRNLMSDLLKKPAAAVTKEERDQAKVGR